jgi:hypothetical protein
MITVFLKNKRRQIRKIMVRSQPRQIASETLSLKIISSSLSAKEHPSSSMLP